MCRKFLSLYCGYGDRHRNEAREPKTISREERWTSRENEAERDKANPETLLKDRIFEFR